MNPFLDLLDTIDKTININISLRPVNGEDIPEISVLVNNDKIFDNKLPTRVGIQKQIDLLAFVKLEIISKNNNAAVIESIEIDGFEIIPDYIRYSSYIGADGNDYGPSEYLGVSGEWNFNIEESFYNWKHKATGMGWLLYP